MKKRAKIASVKNFIAEPVNLLEHNSILMGKVGENFFNLDLSYPLSPFIGFFVGLSAFVSKFGC